MSSPTKPHPDHDGLQYAGPEDLPEVVSTKDDRAYSDKPEMVSPPEHQHHDDKQVIGGYEEKVYQGGGTPAYTDNGAEQQTVKKRGERRVCGLKRGLFFAILAVAIVVVLAAVLGGVLGTVLNKSKSSNSSGSPSGGNPGGGNTTTGNSTGSPGSPLVLDSNAGFAIFSNNISSIFYSYYQEPQGRIVENLYQDGQWNVQGDNIPNNAVIATDAATGTPIAATSWSMNGVGPFYRQVFYLDNNGFVMTSNTTGTQPWSEPYNILIGDSAAIDSNALSVISNTYMEPGGLNGIRVYYASSQGVIRECGMDFGTDFSATSRPTWNMWEVFDDSDPVSGVAAVLTPGFSHVYLRNSTTKQMQQWMWHFVPSTTLWNMTEPGPTDFPSGASIAAATDGTTDHIFYESNEGHLIRALYYGQPISNFQTVATLPATGTKIASAFNFSSSSEGALVYFHNSTDTPVLSFANINRNGMTIQNGTVG